MCTLSLGLVNPRLRCYKAYGLFLMLPTRQYIKPKALRAILPQLESIIRLEYQGAEQVYANGNAGAVNGLYIPIELGRFRVVVELVEGVPGYAAVGKEGKFGEHQI
jgi:hypothetical protein